MDRFYGFDLGDAESAVARLNKESHEAPEILSVADAKSFITAYALTKDGQLLVGEKACYEPNVSERKLRFKSRFLTDKNSKKDVFDKAAKSPLRNKNIHLNIKKLI